MFCGGAAPHISPAIEGEAHHSIMGAFHSLPLLLGMSKVVVLHIAKLRGLPFSCELSNFA